jgi:hypothetical protein
MNSFYKAFNDYLNSDLYQQSVVKVISTYTKSGSFGVESQIMTSSVMLVKLSLMFCFRFVSSKLSLSDVHDEISASETHTFSSNCICLMTSVMFNIQKNLLQSLASGTQCEPLSEIKTISENISFSSNCICFCNFSTSTVCFKLNSLLLKELESLSKNNPDLLI